jgi:hypothetical protein
MDKEKQREALIEYMKMQQQKVRTPSELFNNQNNIIYSNNQVKFFKLKKINSTNAELFHLLKFLFNIC